MARRITLQQTKEIERKFDLGRALPLRARFGDVLAIRQRQCYPISRPGEVRLRHEFVNGQDRYFMTVKSDGGISRQEWEEEIPSWLFEQYWRSGCGRVAKVRRLVPTNDGLVKIDLYEHPDIRVIAEVEFDSEESAAAFVVPDWMKQAVEVTDDARFRAKRVAHNGFPDLVMA